MWLVARQRLFGSVTGCLRAAAYLSATFYGWVFGSVFQDWLHFQSQSMPIPGADLEHYGLAVLLTVETAVSAWLFWPMLYVFRRRLTDAQLERDAIPRASVRFLLLWTALAALILTTVRLLAMYGKPLNIAMAHGSFPSEMFERAALMPLRVVQLVAIAIIMIGFAGNLSPFVHCSSRRSGCLVCWSATSVVGSVVDPRATDNFRRDGQSIGTERLPYQAGTIFAATVVFCFARLTGLAFRNAPANG